MQKISREKLNVAGGSQQGTSRGTHPPGFFPLRGTHPPGFFPLRPKHIA